MRTGGGDLITRTAKGGHRGIVALWLAILILPLESAWAVILSVHEAWAKMLRVPIDALSPRVAGRRGGGASADPRGRSLGRGLFAIVPTP